MREADAPALGRRERDRIRRHVLVLNVDDYEAGRYATSRVLRQAGFEVHEAATGNDALRLVESEHPDLVLLDVNLPDVDGFEVCRQIKTDPETSGIPVLYLSAAYRTAEHRVQGLDLGADGYLTQPVEPRELVATVNALLRSREVEAAVRESEERFRSLVAATSEFVWTTPPSGEVAQEQPGWTHFTGQAPDESLGWGWLGCVHPDERGRVRRAWTQAVGTRTLYQDEYRLRRHDGEYRYVGVSAIPVLDGEGQVREWVGAHTDLTERRRVDAWQRLYSEAGAALAASMDFEVNLPRVARLAVESLGDWCAVDVVDENGLRRVARAAGQDAEGHAASMDTAFPVDRRGAGPFEVALSGRSEFLRDAGGEEAEGTLRMAGIRSYVSVPLVARGQVLGALTLAAADAIPRYTGEDAARLEELGRRVALAVDNARLYAEAIHANAAKSEFLAVMSHELRTPLNAIIGYADLLDAGVAGDLNDPQREQLGRIRIGSKHLLRLIEEVLLFSRLEAGREEVLRERVDLAALAREACALVEPLAREKGLAFRVDLAPEPVWVTTDTGKVHQILLNLLSNAVKFTDAGEVLFTLAEEGAEAVLRVRDTGIGIAPENQERIWDAFSQVEQAPTRRVGGTGLGLSVTRNLARLLGGDVTVESEMGRGSAFTLRLPLAGGAG
ncbi:ATP-binding protein [Longimicrobium sp.]|uniref:ATP-binding protein n=1 Tax=Longimicrobium sp. TaxID=2029185 RepID=UPI002E34E682|nr:ATP-binding protein [Longimicrobium sp.]HEX6036807.1 ATP-binding protein [Longimicrobium sp.]